MSKEHGLIDEYEEWEEEEEEEKEKEYSDEKAGKIIEWFDEMWSQFESSSLAEELSNKTLLDGYFICKCFFNYAYGYCLATPQTITSYVIDEMCLDVLPRKLSCEKETYEAFEPSMTRFLTWCKNEKHISNTQKIIKYIKPAAKEMVALSQDSSNWGMAKSLFMGGELDFEHKMIGHSVPGEQAIPYTPKKTPIKAEPKVGRNELCPCMSGKKYKKCCGQ